MKVAVSNDVFMWAEYKALALRMGIDITRPTRYLRICFGENEDALIQHEYLVTDELRNNGNTR